MMHQPVENTGVFARLGLHFPLPRIATMAAALALNIGAGTALAAKPFHLQEATIEDIQTAIKSKQITTESLVRAYLARIKAYNGRCVNEPEGMLGVVTTIPNAGQINALQTLNLRPASRKALGFDERKARSMTDGADDDASMPDALEVAAAQDRQFARTGKLVGPLHGVVMAIKDQYDTADMRTTSGGDAFWANDRPPHDAEFVKRLRDAGAIILAKANLAEYASGGARSAFGGTFCNPYDTERSPNASSAGSGSSVAANLVTCAIAEETTSSIRGPAVAANTVGIAPTQELVSRHGMIGAGINTRVGPICRTVQDAARILDAIAGYDAKDELTVFSVGRTPTKPYASFANEKRLDGVRIGVMREYMNKKLFNQADAETIDIVDRALADLKKLGATVVDPGPEGELFQGCMKKYGPQLLNTLFAKQYRSLFPLDANGKPAGDQITTYLGLAQDPSKVPTDFSVRELEQARAMGEGKYMIDRYLQERGDANIKSNADLIGKARFYNDSHFPDRKQIRENAEKDMELNLADRMLQRFAVQQIVLQCMQEQNLDAVAYPTSNLPPAKLTAPSEPTLHGRGAGGIWTFLGRQGFPAITVPAGFTTEVYDRVADPTAPPPAPRPNTGEGGGVAPVASKLVGPIPAKLPVGIDFLGRPFSEPTLLKISSAYEAATKHRTPPPGFGSVAGEP